MNPPRRISVNAAYQLVAQAAVLALSLVSSPIVVHGLGLEAYGLLLIVGIATNYFGFVELGLGRAAVQLLGGHRVRGEKEEFRAVLWTGIGAYFVLSLVGAAALVAVAPILIRDVFSVSATLAPEARWAFVIGGISLVIAMQRNLASSVATAYERWDLIGRVTLGTAALQTVASVLLVLRGAGLTGVMLGGLFVQLLAVALYWMVARSLVPGLFPPLWSGARLAALVRFGGYVTVSQVVAPLLEHIEKVLIASLAAVSALPFYALPYSVAWALTAVPNSLASVIYPAMVRLRAENDEAGVRETLRRATRYVFAVLIGPVVLLVLYAREILAAWMGPAFAAEAQGCLRILACGVLAAVIAWPSYQLLHAVGRADLAARYHLAELVLYVPTSALLILHAGVQGAAWAWLLRAMLDAALMCRAAAAIAALPLRRFVGEALGRGMVAAAVVLPVALAGRAWVAPDMPRAETVLLLALVGLAYVPAVAWIGIGAQERATVVVTLRTLVGARAR